MSLSAPIDLEPPAMAWSLSEPLEVQLVFSERQITLDGCGQPCSMPMSGARETSPLQDMTGMMGRPGREPWSPRRGL